MQDLLQVGVISSTHGIAGEVKVFPTTDDVNRFDYLKDVILDTGREKLNLTVAGVKYFKNMVILKFKGMHQTLLTCVLIILMMLKNTEAVLSGLQGRMPLN